MYLGYILDCFALFFFGGLLLSAVAAVVVVWLFADHTTTSSSGSRSEAVQPIQPFNSKCLRNPYAYSKLPADVDCYVIGSGMGGLATAAFLARSGKKVVVLESNHILGGCLQQFEKRGIVFDTGLHIVGRDKPFIELLRCISDVAIEFLRIPSDPTDNVHTELFVEDKSFPIAGASVGGNIVDGWRNFRRSLEPLLSQDELLAVDAFQVEIERCFAMLRYLRVLRFLPRWMCTLLGAFFFRKCEPFISEKTEEMLTKVSHNPLVHSLLGCFWTCYGVTPADSPFMLHSMVMQHFMNGMVYPKGGGMAIANSVVRFINSKGGKLFTKARVSELILSRNNHIVGVRVGNDLLHAESCFCHWCFENIRACTATVLVKTRSIFSVDAEAIFLCAMELDLPERSVMIYPSLNIEDDLRAYSELDIDNILSSNQIRPPWLFVTFPSAKDPSLERSSPGKSSAILMIEAKYEWFEIFLKMGCVVSGKRGTEYDTLKNMFGEAMLRVLFSQFPQLQTKTLFVEVSTPLTTEYYLSSKNGCAYGLHHSEDRFKKWLSLSPRTPIDNLFLSGGDVMICGVSGALHGGLSAAMACMSPVEWTKHFAMLSSIYRRENQFQRAPISSPVVGSDELEPLCKGTSRADFEAAESAMLDKGKTKVKYRAMTPVA